MSSMSRWVNREWAGAPDADFSNGCFETMRVYGGKSYRLRQHIKRLYESAAYLQTRPEASPEALEAQLLDAVKQSGLKEAVLRVALVPRPNGLAEARIVVQPVVMPSREDFVKGIAVAVVPSRSFPIGAIDPRAKYSARLGSKLAVLDAAQRGVDEALFIDAQGYVTENTASNYAIVARGKIVTPPCHLGLLWGITRQLLFECAEAIDVPIEEIPLTRHDIYNASEAFFTSTIKEVLPITAVDGRRIGEGAPGPVTRRMHRAFIDAVERELQVKVRSVATEILEK